MSSEFQRIERLRALYAAPSPGVQLAIGDDCAVLAPSPYAQAFTVDAAVAFVHFDLGLMTLTDVGFRSFMAAVSDLAAMGATPLAALSALLLPAELTDEDLDTLACGIRDASRLCGCPVVGGNLGRARELSITTSVIGACRGPVLTRGGARPGDHVFVTGPLGGAALGLAALQRGHAADARFAPAIACFLRPRARVDVSEELSAKASAAIDVSDGLWQDLSHLCRASKVDATIALAKVPRILGFEDLAAELGLSAAQLIAAGGEDYEVVFTAPGGSIEPFLATPIGHVTAGDGQVRIRDPQGVNLAAAPGFDHFR